MKEISPKFHQYLEDLAIEKKKMEEKARQDAAEMQARPIRDKTERPLKKAEFIAASDKRKQQGWWVGWGGVGWGGVGWVVECVLS